MQKLKFNTWSKFVSCCSLGAIIHARFLSKHLKIYEPNSIDSFFEPAIASMLLRICLRKFLSVNSESGKAEAGRDRLLGVQGTYSTRPRIFRNIKTRATNLGGAREVSGSY